MPFVLAHPPLPRDTRLLVLPHPQSGAPAYFAAGEADSNGYSTLYEMLTVRGEKHAARSWFIAPNDTEDSQSHGSVIADGAMRVLSPIDGGFVLLGIVFDERKLSQRWVPLDDLLDAAAESHTQRRARRHPDSAAAPWPDVCALRSYHATTVHLSKVFETQPIGIGSSELVYRFSWDRTLTWLDAKLERLAQPGVFDKSPETLSRQVNRRLDATCTDRAATALETAAARRAVSVDLIASYLPAAVAKRWRERVAHAEGRAPA